jgi:hypothetical protein
MLAFSFRRDPVPFCDSPLVQIAENRPPEPLYTTGDTNDISSYIQEVMDNCGDFGAVYRLLEKLSTSLSATPCNMRGNGAYSIERTANAVALFRP